MQIEHAVIPLPPLIFLLAVIAAPSVADVLGLGRATAQAGVAIGICVGSLVARVAFVARYVSDYGDLWQVWMYETADSTLRPDCLDHCLS